jgi:hypothetical protein
MDHHKNPQQNQMLKSTYLCKEVVQVVHKAAKEAIRMYFFPILQRTFRTPLEPLDSILVIF